MDPTPSSAKLRAEKHYKRLTPIIQEVNKEVIAIKEELKLTTRNVMNQVVNYVVKRLKKVNMAFEAMYRGKRRVGSFFDNTKVNEPTEFDVYIILQFPFPEKKSELRHAQPGYVQVCAGPGIGKARRKWTGGYVGQNTRSTVNQLVDSNGFIRRDKVMDWWQSIFAQAIPTTSLHLATIDGKNYWLKWSTSSSGIQVHVSDGGAATRMHIDMVPVLRFKGFEHISRISELSETYEELETYATAADSSVDENEKFPKQWYIFPKPRKQGDTDRMDLLWGLSFWDQEKELLHNKEHMKPAYRLIKRLRDNYAWKPLTSYYIKTLFLWEANDTSLYRKNIGYLFVYFLAQLESELETTSLVNYWSEDMNLLQEISTVTLNDWRGCLNRILKTIHRHLDSGDTAQLETYVRKLFIGGPGTQNPPESFIPPVPSRTTRLSYQVPESKNLSSTLRSEVRNTSQDHYKSTPLCPVRPLSQRNYNTGDTGGQKRITIHSSTGDRITRVIRTAPTYQPEYEFYPPGHARNPAPHYMPVPKSSSHRNYESQKYTLSSSSYGTPRFEDLPERLERPESPESSPNWWLRASVALGVTSVIALVMMK